MSLFHLITARLDPLNEAGIENRFRLQRRELGIGSGEDGVDFMQAFRFGPKIAAIGPDHCVVPGLGVFDSVKP
jgi:hypothetical protein